MRIRFGRKLDNMDNKDLISEMLGIPTSVESAEKIIRNNEATMLNINTTATISYLMEEVSKLTGHNLVYIKERILKYKEDYIKSEAKKLYEHWQEVEKECNE